MSKPLNLDQIDVDGAVRETAAEAMDALGGDTRSAFLRRAGLAGGALVGGGAILGALAPAAMAFSTGDRPPAKFGKGDIGILNYALTLEYLESTFYNEATSHQHKHGFIKDAETRVFLRTVTDDENQHVAALKKVLGHHAVKKPKFDFHGDNAEEKKFKTAAFTFENEGVHAYSGQAFNIKDPKVLRRGPLDRHYRGASRLGDRPDRAAFGARHLPQRCVRQAVRCLARPRRRHQPQLHRGLTPQAGTASGGTCAAWRTCHPSFTACAPLSRGALRRRGRPSHSPRRIPVSRGSHARGPTRRCDPR